MRTVRIRAENMSVYRRLNPDSIPPEVLGSVVYEEVPLIFAGFDPEVRDVVCDDDGIVRFTLSTYHDIIVDRDFRRKLPLGERVGILCELELDPIDELCPLIERESSEPCAWEVVA